MASKFSVNRINQIFPDNKLRSNQSEVDDSLTKQAFKKALGSPKTSKTKSPNSLSAMIAKQ